MPNLLCVPNTLGMQFTRSPAPPRLPAWRLRNEVDSARNLRIAYLAKLEDAAYTRLAGNRADAVALEEDALLIGRHAAPKCLAVGLRALGAAL